MFESIKKFFSNAWNWIQSLWDKHDEQLEQMVAAVLPMVIDLAFRLDLTGNQKRDAIVDAIVDTAETSGRLLSKSMINEAVEIAANRYNIQIGKLTKEAMDLTLEATIAASRLHVNGKLNIAGIEAEAAGVVVKDHLPASPTPPNNAGTSSEA